MTKYISWGNILGLWAIVLLFVPLALDDGGEVKTSHMVIRALITFAVAYEISDIICRYQSQNRRKDD
jgi:hypothetical protein